MVRVRTKFKHNYKLPDEVSSNEKLDVYDKWLDRVGLVIAVLTVIGVTVVALT